MTNHQNIVVSEASRGDAGRIWEIRYHPLVNAVSGNQEMVDRASSEQWFIKKYFGGEDNKCFVLKHSGEIVGYCRFDTTHNGPYVISIALDPAFHGHGLGQVLLSETLHTFGGNESFRAVIKKNNQPSLKLFQRNGFVVTAESEDSFELTKASN
ncbi:MAG: GNAT family N-acetyltransferase [Candidatus Magasanikbacteria bacterium]|nr:GNAT family N-acetyltransferase [Candidatus Magasanikbacteria bacterium]